MQQTWPATCGQGFPLELLDEDELELLDEELLDEELLDEELLDEDELELLDDELLVDEDEVDELELDEAEVVEDELDELEACPDDEAEDDEELEVLDAAPLELEPLVLVPPPLPELWKKEPGSRLPDVGRVHAPMAAAAPPAVMSRIRATEKEAMNHVRSVRVPWLAPSRFYPALAASFVRA